MNIEKRSKWHLIWRKMFQELGSMRHGCCTLVWIMGTEMFLAKKSNHTGCFSQWQVWPPRWAKIWWEGHTQTLQRTGDLLDVLIVGHKALLQRNHMLIYQNPKWASIHTCLTRLSTCKKIICMTNQIKEGYCLMLIGTSRPPCDFLSKNNEILCRFFLIWDLQ